MTLTLSSADGYQLEVLQTKYEHCNLKNIGVRENVEFSGPILTDRWTENQKVKKTPVTQYALYLLMQAHKIEGNAVDTI